MPPAAPIFDPEPFIQGALDYLEAGMPAMLASIEAANSDGIELPAPRQYVFGVVDSALGYPVIDAAVPDFNATQFDLAHLEADYEFQLIIRVQQRYAATDDGLDRSLYRYNQAMFRLLAQPAALPASAEVTEVRGGFRANPETEEREQLIGRSILALTVEHRVGAF